MNQNFEFACTGLLRVCLLLLKKGVIMNDNMLNGLNARVNTLNVLNFDLLLASPFKQKILTELVNDAETYQGLLGHIIGMYQQTTNPSDVDGMNILLMC